MKKRFQVLKSKNNDVYILYYNTLKIINFGDSLYNTHIFIRDNSQWFEDTETVKGIFIYDDKGNEELLVPDKSWKFGITDYSNSRYFTKIMKGERIYVVEDYNHIKRRPVTESTENPIF